MLLVTSLGRTKSSEDDSCRLHEIPNNVVFAGTSVSTFMSSGWYAQCYLVSSDLSNYAHVSLRSTSSLLRTESQLIESYDQEQ